MRYTEEYISGTSSDYEKFFALMYSAKFMPGHPAAVSAVNILKTVSGQQITGLNFSRKTTEDLWQKCNESIESKALAPLSLASLIGVKELYLRFAPYELLNKIKKESAPLIRPVFDIGEVCSEKSLEKLTEISPEAETFEEFISHIEKKLDYFISNKCRALRMTLSGFVYRKNSKKKEISDTLLKIKNGISAEKEKLNEIATSIATETAYMAEKKKIPLFLEIKNTEEQEIEKLYSYLKLNCSVPETVLITEYPASYENFMSEFEFTTENSLPGIVPASNDPKSISSVFPLGFILFKYENINEASDLGQYLSYPPKDISDLLNRHAVKRFGI